MSNRFFIADTHFGHKGMVKFGRSDGTPERPEWGRVDPDMSIEEATERVAAMDEAMVERWNAIIGPKDIVEVIGDVVINRNALSILARLNGRKRLRMGNHDIFIKKWNRDYLPYFEEITAYKIMVKEGLICSHIPIHKDSLGTRWKANVHGHLHSKQVMDFVMWKEAGGMYTYAGELPDPRYLCVSVEHTNFAPISLDEVLDRIAKRQEDAPENINGK